MGGDGGGGLWLLTGALGEEVTSVALSFQFRHFPLEFIRKPACLERVPGCR